ncbi:hypothetical protein ACWGJT_02810 [Streptomyces xantholiticus]
MHGNVRSRPCTERRQLLLDVLAPIDPPIQPVLATDDYGETFTSPFANFLVEVLAGTTRHAVETVTRVR